MNKTLACFVVASLFVALPASADETTTAPVGGGGSAVAASGDHDLGKIHGSLTAEGARSAGQSRDVAVSISKTNPNVPARPVASPRTVRRLGVSRALESVDANVRACASENASSAPTTLPLRIAIAPSGDVEGAELASPARVAPSLVTCAVNAVSAARFGSPGSAGAMIVVSITVPARPAIVTAPSKPAIVADTN